MKTYVYKHYSQGVFKGVLDDCISPFELKTEINTAGAQLQIELARSLQNSGPSFTIEELVDENDETIVTDKNETIEVDSSVSISGMPNLNDRIEVWEYDSVYNPSGLIKFNGLVSSWEAGYKDTTVTLTLLSYGIQLDNQLMQIVDEEVVVDNSGGTAANRFIKGLTNPAAITGDIKIAQTFTVPVQTGLSSIDLWIKGPTNANYGSTIWELTVFEGTPITLGQQIASTSRTTYYIAGSTLAQNKFTFAQELTLDASKQYCFIVTLTGVDSVYFNGAYHSNGNNYSDGTSYGYTSSSGWLSLGRDIRFIFNKNTVSLVNNFASTDPSVIVMNAIDAFATGGTSIRYDSSIDSIELSSTVVSYIFKFYTYYEVLKKCIELAPANWWYFVHPGSGVVYFKPQPQTPDHTFILGKHLEDANFKYSLEEVKNSIFFSGGDDGSGTNLQQSDTDQISIQQYGTWLDRPSDNRVTNSSTATTIIDSILNEKSDPKFGTTIEISAGKYDVSSIQVGQAVGFKNFNSLIDSLVLQIMSVKEAAEGVTLVLAVLPPHQSKRIEDIKRNLEKQQTENNPETL